MYNKNMNGFKHIENEKGYIKIAAIDHRDSLKKLFPEYEFYKFKVECTEQFAPYCTSVLVDPEYGMGSVEKAKSLNLGVLMTREQSGMEETPYGRKNILYSQFSSEELKKMGANAIKLLIYYNTESLLAKDQRELAKKVYEEAHSAGLPLLLEIVTYPIEGEFYHKGDAIIKSIQELKGYADILKIEYPLEIFTGHIEEIRSAIPYLSQIHQIADNKPWVLLSRGMPFDSYIKALEVSKDEGCKGFAVGRAVWQELGNYTNWDDKANFIKTTAVDRVKKLSDLFN
jgi:tagatose 1,6-diphosphate aldolase